MNTFRRKISTVRGAIKPAISAAGLGFFLPLVVAGCAAATAEAPFPARADTVIPGDLRGPFDGRVLDADTGKPVDAAAVLASWALEEGRGLAGPAAARTTLVETDADGRYHVAATGEPTDVGVRIARFTLIVYKRGYVAYRSDRHFDDLSPRRDFAQNGNQIRLKRQPTDVSHARHLAYVGAGGPLLSRLSWELPLAAQEIAPSPPPPAAPAAGEAVTEEQAEKPEAPAKSPGPPLDPTVLLTPDELKAVTGFKGDFEALPLADLPTTSSYGSLHFRAVGKPERFDAALRVFKLPSADAEHQFETLAKELPAVKEGRELGDRSLRATEGDLLAVGTLDRAEGVVLLFTCGKALCGDHQTMVAIAKRMAARFARLARPKAAGEAGPPETPPPSAPGEFHPLRLRPPELKR